MAQRTKWQEGLTKIPSSAKTVNSSPLWISRLPFHTVPDVDCFYNRKQAERERETEAEKRKAARQSASLSKSNQQRERLASCRPLIMALG